MAFNWVSCLKITLLFFLIAAIATAFLTLPVEQTLKDFLLWVKQDLGPWGPLVLYACCGNTKPYVMLGGGYLLGLPMGFIVDSIGATVGATAAFLLGRTILFLIRLVPIIPFNMLNYALSVTPIPLGKYILALWLGKMLLLHWYTLEQTLKDLSDVTHGWHDFSKAHWALIIAGLVVSGCKDALEKALAEKEDIDSIAASPEQPIVADPTADLHQPLMITIDHDDHEN